MLFVLTGCGSVQVRSGGCSGSARLTDGMKKGGSAVVLVDGMIDDTSLATRYFWGIMHVRRPERTFAELFSHSAAKEIGLEISLLENAEQKTGGPDPAAEEKFEKHFREAKEQGHDFIFKVNISSWHQNYILFFQWARIDFEMHCYSLHSGDVVWGAETKKRRWYVTDRELLAGVLSKILSSTRDKGPNSFSRLRLKKN